MTRRHVRQSGSVDTIEEQNDIYYGRTELGVGQHEEIRKRLEAERHREYQEHMAKKTGETILAKELENDAPGQSTERTSSVADIGYESSTKMAQQQKQLNETRKAEYVAMLAAKTGHSASSQTDHQDGIPASTQTNKRQEEVADNQAQSSTKDDVYYGGFRDDHSWWPGSDNLRRERQRNYAEALREQIAEQKHTKEVNKIREKEDDRRRDVEQSQSSCFNYGYFADQSPKYE